MATGKGNSKIHVQGGKREKKVTNRQMPRFSSVESTVQTNNKGKISEMEREKNCLIKRRQFKETNMNYR